MAGALGRFFPVQFAHFGTHSSFATFNEATIPLAGLLGTVVEDSGKVYRLVLHNKGTASVATVAGYPAYWKTRASFEVTADASDGEGKPNCVAGGYLGVITDGYYCYIQVGGLQSAYVDNNTAVGDQMSGHASTDGTLIHTTAGTASVNLAVAIAYAANASGGAAAANCYWILGALL